jgi:(2Fe-2S) ferredoxin
MKPTRHVFICTNRRDAASGMPSCGANDGAHVLAALREARAARGLYRELFVTESACLGVCPEAGATLVVYPEGVWYVGVRRADAGEIFEQHLVQGKPVARLLDARFA